MHSLQLRRAALPLVGEARRLGLVLRCERNRACRSRSKLVRLKYGPDATTADFEWSRGYVAGTGATIKRTSAFRAVPESGGLIRARFNPFLNHGFSVGQRLLVRCPVGSAARQLGDFSDECLIVLAPVQNDFVTYVIRH